MADLFGNKFHTLESTLIAREQLQRSISSNIANADTPNYAADERSFADFLSVQQGRATSEHLAATQPGHFREAPGGGLGSSLFHQKPNQRMDGNNVDAQQEMARMAENQLMHDLAGAMLKGKLNGLLNAIKEGNR